MDKLTAIKIKQNGTYSSEIPIGATASNVDWDSTYSLTDVLGNVAISTKGSIQNQIDSAITNYGVGENMQGKTQTVGSTTYTGQTGAARFSSNSNAIGTKATAFGSGTVALGDYSFATGNNTIANGDNQHVLGKYNVADTTSAEIVGGGTANNARTNIRTLDWDGNETLASSLTIGTATDTDRRAVELDSTAGSIALVTNGSVGLRGIVLGAIGNYPATNMIIGTSKNRVSLPNGAYIASTKAAPLEVSAKGTAENTGTTVFIPSYSYTNVGVSSSAGASDFIKALIKKICIDYPDYAHTNFTGPVTPGSRAMINCYIYNTSTVDLTTGLPEYAFGEYIGVNNNYVRRFRIWNYTYSESVLSAPSFLETNTSLTSMASNSITNLCSLSLTTGIWVVSGQISMSVTTGDSFRLIASISDSTSDYSPTTGGYVNIPVTGPPSTTVVINPTRILEVTAASKTIYLIGNQNSGTSKTLTSNRCLLKAAKMGIST